MRARKDNPMRIRLSDERKAEIVRKLIDEYARTFDEELSPFRSAQILEFFVRTLGPSVYNQAIQDARAFMSDRLEDLDATFYEAEDQGRTTPSTQS